ncbi:Derlin [Caligus rogercresseyi]|uniref:Derlin n=1 Tax=Caligus rogercresseyi TaxID=217165 RepID=A0A7T8HJM2_CALRO|nr:Derlin [Caligus rogercresseyi]
MRLLTRKAKVSMNMIPKMNRMTNSGSTVAMCEMEAQNEVESKASPDLCLPEDEERIKIQVNAQSRDDDPGHVGLVTGGISKYICMAMAGKDILKTRSHSAIPNGDH